MGHVACINLTGRHRQGADIGHKVVAWVGAVEGIGELHNTPDACALTQLEVAADAQINLCQRSTAKFIQRGLLTVDHSAIIGYAVAVDVNAGPQRVRTPALEL